MIKSMDELDNFCKEFGYHLLLEIPFKQIEGFLLRVVKGDEEIGCIPFVKIEEAERSAATLLGKLAKDH